MDGAPWELNTGTFVTGVSLYAQAITAHELPAHWNLAGVPAVYYTVDDLYKSLLDKRLTCCDQMVPQRLLIVLPAPLQQ
jgi:hypothetical protein